jgi:hypothetical protein
MAEPTELDCQSCAGTGKIRMVFDLVPGRMPNDPLDIDCPRCRGTGLVPLKAKVTPSRPWPGHPRWHPDRVQLPWPVRAP